MSSILLTGATGFIGKYTLTVLRKTPLPIHVISRQLAPYHDKNLTWHTMDLHDHQKIKKLIANIKPTHLLHLAWITTPTIYWESKENDRWLESSINLIKYFCLFGQRVVTIGTSAEYGLSHHHCEEISECHPTTRYGKTKLQLFLETEKIAKKHHIMHAHARIFYLYGPDEPYEKLVSSAIHAFYQKKNFFLNYQNEIRDFLYVKDVANALSHLTLSSLEGAINIASGKPLSTYELIHMIAKQLNSTHLIKIKYPKEKSPALIASNNRLMKELLFTPYYSNEEAIKETIHWWKNIWA